jgi:hypothetical protein
MTSKSRVSLFSVKKVGYEIGGEILARIQFKDRSDIFSLWSIVRT